MKYEIEHYLENIYFHYKIGFTGSKIYKDTYWCNSTAGAHNLSCVDFAYTQIEKDNNILEVKFEAFCKENKLKPNLMKLVSRIIFIDAYDNELVPKYFINVKDKSEQSMTYGELYDKAIKTLNLDKNIINDYRPASQLFIEQIMCQIPNAIIIWLKSGEKIIFIDKEEK